MTFSGNFLCCRYNVLPDSEHSFVAVARQVEKLVWLLAFCTVWGTGRYTDMVIKVVEQGLLSARDALVMIG